jgi:multidrug efflux pump subunit AcrB
MSAIQGAVAFPFNLPPILGLGSTGGFQYALEALQGQSPSDVAAALRGLVVAANAAPELAGVYSTYAADTPQIYLDIDRDKAQVLGVKITDIFSALQSTLGSYYVNDFNVFGRTWQVNIQAETPFRDNIDDIYQIYVRNAQGGMVPIRALADAKLVQGPQTLVRYNGFRAAIVNGAAKPGYSSGQALTAMDRNRVAGKAGRRTHRDRARIGHPVRVSVSRRPLRKLEYPDPRFVVGQRRNPRRDHRHPAGAAELRRLRPDRARGADRARSQERHSDRGVRGGTA